MSVPFDPSEYVGADLEPWNVTCARCGATGTTETFILEEGDEWECPPCWKRCEAESYREAARQAKQWWIKRPDNQE